jgi:hypothetical protein
MYSAWKEGYVFGVKSPKSSYNEDQVLASGALYRHKDIRAAIGRFWRRLGRTRELQHEDFLEGEHAEGGNEAHLRRTDRVDFPLFKTYYVKISKAVQRKLAGEDAFDAEAPPELLNYDFIPAKSL